MQIEDVFLDELRLMFMEGATPSRLIRQIARRFAGGTTCTPSCKTASFRRLASVLCEFPASTI